MFKKYFEDIKSKFIKLIKVINSHKGISILIGSLLISIISQSIIFIAPWAFLLYLVILIKNTIDRYFDFKKQSSIDLSFFKINEEDILDEFVSKQLADVLLYHNLVDVKIAPESELEEKVRQLLIESVAKHISLDFIKKLELYYGKGNVIGILGEKCYIQLSLYIAGKSKDYFINDSEK